MIINHVGANNTNLNTLSKTGNHKNVREYSKYLRDKYSCLTPGNNVAVTVTSGMLKKAMTDEKTGKWLERELNNCIYPSSILNNHEHFCIH